MSAEQIKSMSNYFQQTLTRALEADDTVVSKLNGVLESDWTRICKFNAVTPESHDRCIHEIIQEQTLLQPESEAVCSWDGSLTYRELDQLASQLAYHLQAQGVGPEVRVALCFDKSVSVPNSLTTRNKLLFVPHYPENITAFCLYHCKILTSACRNGILWQYLLS